MDIRKVAPKPIVPKAVELHFSRTNGPIDERIDALIQAAGGVRRPEIVRQMILAALKAGQEDDEKADLKLMNTTLKEMRFTSKIFGPYKQIKKVSVFGSARAQPDDSHYQMALAFGHALAQAGYMVITGGGGGIMQAANEGAGPEHSFGVNIRLPFEQEPNPVIKGNPRYINYKYFFNRKVAFLKEAHAVALFPGGFGTQDEAMETLTLVQTGKHDPVPIILVERPDGTYWSRWMLFVERELLARDLISPTDLTLFERCTTIDAAVSKINQFYRRYHSIRYVDGKLVMRLLSRLSDAQVDLLNQRFESLLEPKGTISPSGPLPQEADEPEIAHLPRLVIDFNRKAFGQLVHLIRTLNAM